MTAVLWEVIIQPFSPRLWLCVAMTVGGISLVFWFQCKLTNWSTSEVAIVIYGIFCNQAASMQIQRHSVRILLFSACITAILVINSYSAILISFLAIQDEKLPFNSFQEMLDIGFYRLGMIPDTAAVATFKYSPNDLFRQIYKSLILPVAEREAKPKLAFMERMCAEENYAFLDIEKEVMALRSQCSCEVVPVRGAYYPESFCLTLQKNSPYTRIINYYIHLLREAGILRRFQKASFPPVKDGLASSTAGSIALTSIAPVLVFFLLAVVASAAIMFIERQRYVSRNIDPQCMRKPKVVTATR